MQRLFAHLTFRRTAAATALVALAAIAFGLCVCELPQPRAVAGCHASGEAAAPGPKAVRGSDACCTAAPELPPGTLEARAPETPRGSSQLAAAGALAIRLPATDRPGLMPAAPWRLAAFPPHAPPPAFVLPLRV